MYFVGIDLAWSKGNKTSIAITKGDKTTGKLCYCDYVDSNGEIIDKINQVIGKDNAIIAIDAPLIVPNEEGSRKAERDISSYFWQCHAGAYSSSRSHFMDTYGCIRGEELSSELEEANFCHDPYLQPFEKERKFFEVYPHPAMVVLFELDRILQYKEKRKRSYETRWDAFRTYQSKMKTLSAFIPSLFLDVILEKDVNGLKGKALKKYEDTLDAVFCSYLAYYTWANPDKCHVFGNMEEGYICTPINRKL